MNPALDAPASRRVGLGHLTGGDSPRGSPWNGCGWERCTFCVEQHSWTPAPAGVMAGALLPLVSALGLPVWGADCGQTKPESGLATLLNAAIVENPWYICQACPCSNSSRSLHSWLLSSVARMLHLLRMPQESKQISNMSPMAILLTSLICICRRHRPITHCHW